LVAAPLPPRLRTMLSSIGAVNCGGRTTGNPWNFTTYAPRACAASASRVAVAKSAGLAPCIGGSTKASKRRGRFTMLACSGWASGTRMISIRKRAEAVSCSGSADEHPASSSAGRTGAWPET